MTRRDLAWVLSSSDGSPVEVERQHRMRAMERLAPPFRQRGAYAPGCICIDWKNGTTHVNVGTLASPLWAPVR